MLLALTVAAGGCAPAYTPPVPVQGEVSRLEGRWVGEYSNPLLNRSGSIEFVLGPGADTAQGSVLMIPAPSQRISGTRYPGPNAVQAGPQLLQIQLVRVEGNRVYGRIAPYRDPESGMMVIATFSGYLDGDTIEGKFFTFDTESTWAVEGQWRVARQH
jgi:hypothetical protein